MGEQEKNVPTYIENELLNIAVHKEELNELEEIKWQDNQKMLNRMRKRGQFAFNKRMFEKGIVRH